MWVDLYDGQGERFLAEDTPTSPEMYAHVVETFDDNNIAEPIVSRSQPTVMPRQFIEPAPNPGGS